MADSYNLIMRKLSLLQFVSVICVASSVRTDWGCMHRAGVEEMKDIVSEYLEAFPCEDCRDHFNGLVATHCFPLEYVTTDEEARIWSWLTHNIVNERIGKPWEPFSVMSNYIGECVDGV